MSETSCGYYWRKRYDGKELLVDADGIYWDKVNYQKAVEGLNIVIFDEENETIADAVGIIGDTMIR